MLIRDLFDHGSGREIFGFEINIPDPQHWFQLFRKIIRCLGIWSWPWVAPIYGVSSSSVYHNKTDGMTLLAGRKLPLIFWSSLEIKTHNERQKNSSGHPNNSWNLEVRPAFAYKWKSSSKSHIKATVSVSYSFYVSGIWLFFISQSDSGRI
jgi:hypothetical protein